MELMEEHDKKQPDTELSSKIQIKFCIKNPTSKYN